MRRTFAFTLASVLVLGMVCIPIHFIEGAVVQSEDSLPTIRIQPDNVTLREGEIFTVSIIIENIPADPGMMGVQFKISWDPTILTALNMTEVMFHLVTPPSEWINIWELLNVINNSVGYLSYVNLWKSPYYAIDGGYAPISGNYTLAIVTLQALNGGSTALHFSWVDVVDFDARTVICSSDRLSEYTPLFSSLIVDGHVKVWNLKEDINVDGVVDLFDATLVSAHFGLNEGEPDWDAKVDINGDGTIDIFDVIAVAQKFGESI